ncbi:hypothetical protein [Clostridium magnum]|uniref:Uncharacterized protein n=1 Tax=Clostridium magnum DSM 2767 TaxID=1121326 RepID=A0A162QN17_9CLOT|nr:hypothetical protein [Clostridium magnum]KZL88735.1 hypothetical protein CLMAG_60240 [Clostridium magnum DSM 2767]SHJ61909.1 hypothetical protein SAMN02745944_06246 [Clostridium magnum DSM 2767]
MKNLYQPIKFKRTKKAKWETGFRMINGNGETFLEKDMKVTVSHIYKYEISWF